MAPRRGAGKCPTRRSNVKIEDSVAEITLNRPERLNAWNDQFGGELRQAILEDAADRPCGPC